MQRVQALSLHIQSGKPPPGYSYSKRHPRLSYGFTDLSEPLQRIRALSIHINYSMLGVQGLLDIV